jgi:hypothetical protein
VGSVPPLAQYFTVKSRILSSGEQVIDKMGGGMTGQISGEVVVINCPGYGQDS